jgi:peptidoglycan/xylan/chitin deacetylase (PgdA/CDA1 family)
MRFLGEPLLTSEQKGAPLIVTTSWDDGHPSDLRVADLLEKHGLSGTFYIPSRNSEGRPVMRAADIIRLGRRFEIGGHTQDHISLTDVAPDEAAGQILANKQWLEDLLGRELRGFAYVRGHHNRVVRNLVAQAGYRYARTIKNLMSTPGTDRLQIPTTTQFFAHAKSIYLRNYLSGGPTIQRAAILKAMLPDDELASRCLRAAGICARTGGYFHLWGHSWEISEFNLWDALDRCLARLGELDARFVTNAGWCAKLAISAKTDAAIAAGGEVEGPAPSASPSIVVMGRDGGR